MDSSDILKSMSRYPFYIDNEHILPRIVWEPVGKSNVAFDRHEREEAMFVLPAKITFFVGPLGAFSPHYGSLDKAKYRMTCVAPENAQLAGIFHRGMELMRSLQHMVARMTSRQFLLDTVDNEERLIVSLPVFEKRPIPIVPHTYLADLVEDKKDPAIDFFSDDDTLDSEPTLDDNTKNYPVPPEYVEQFDAIKNIYSVNVLPIYYKNRLVPTLKVPRVLENATVELHVALTHNYMRKDTDRFDSFTGYIRQVIVHELGTPKPLSPYKRKDPREGPFLPIASSSSSNSNPAASPSKRPKNLSSDV
ncbi:hypothetical protein JB92DRAFT_3111304 [Gautieria morchelliformis]|nr:hypothetical protein JB92DRAFT_3111304 [Gautieria morchelliformis]